MTFALTFLAIFTLSLGIAQGAPITITDTVGRELNLPAVPERIVTTDVASFGLVAGLGVVPVGAVIDPAHVRNSYLYPLGTEIPDLGTDPWTPDLEKIAAASPDLILGWDVGAVPGLADLAPFYDVAGLGKETDDYIRLTREMGDLLGRETEAEVLITRYEDRLAAYQAMLPKGRHPNVLYASTNKDQYWIYSTDDLTCQMIALLSGCEWDNPTGEGTWYETNIEGIYALDAEEIILNAVDPDVVRKALADNVLWNEVGAVQADRVHYVSGDIGTPYSVAQFIQALDITATILYPDIFPEPLTDEQVQDILAESE